MKIQDLFEAPLPDDWDKDIYNERMPFATRVKYATERAEKVGIGSSRVAFKIPYQGRQTVLKIAKNRKGAAQNKAEAELLSDYYLRGINIAIPMIDYDERNNQPTWIHTEIAPKFRSDSQLERALGFKTGQLWLALAYINDLRTGSRGHFSKPTKETIESEGFDRLQDLLLNFTNIVPADLSRAANWGMYKGRAVIVDLGLTDDTLHLYS